MLRLPHLTLAAILVLEAPWLLPHPFERSDLLFAWYAGRLVVSGASPYDAGAWAEGASRHASLLGRLIAWRATPRAHADHVLLAGVLVVSLAATPNVYSYDHLLLAPAVCTALLAGLGLAPRARAVVLAATVAVVTLAPWVLFYAANDAGSAAPIALVPPAFAALLVLTALAARRTVAVSS